jgi:hypothetical protein
MVNSKILFDSKKVEFLKSGEKEIVLKGDFSYLFIRTPTSYLTLPLGDFETVTVRGEDLSIIYAYNEKFIQGDVEYVVVCRKDCCKRYLVTTDSVDLVDSDCHNKKDRNYSDEWYEHWFYPPL